MPDIFQDLLSTEVEMIRGLGTHVDFKANEQLFLEGDEADYLYFIESGGVSLYIDKFNTRIEIQRAEPGNWFGEMAVYSGGHRTASAVAVEDSRFLRVAKAAFHGILAEEPDIDGKLRDIVERRNLKLVIEEKMVDVNGVRDRDTHIGIKGDPSLRESAMERPRYVSVVDRFMPELVQCLEDLLLNRTVHRAMIGFNNGEIRLSTLLDPFSEEFHPVLRLLDASYVERHFPKIDYQRKTDIIRRIYRGIEDNDFFAELPTHLNHGFQDYFGNWEPVPPEQLSSTLAQLPQLRNIPDFYARNITVSILKNVIHMQFNCDGTHIVSARGYERFLKENL